MSFTLLDQVQLAGKPCRPPKDECDLGEFCDGQQALCPEDAFQENGTPCRGGYCYNGDCPTLAQRCQDLWGPGEAGVTLVVGPTGPPGWLQVLSCRADLPLACRCSSGRGGVLRQQHLRRLCRRGLQRQVSFLPPPESPGSKT